MYTKRLSIVVFLLITSLFGQLKWYNHSELEWKTIETKHFKIHYHQGTERSAREAAEVAEHVYVPITNLYDFQPKTKTEIIVKDVDDYSNGAAYFFENMIEIWAKPLDYDLRGSHRWIQDVIAHEFTHVVQIGKSMKFSNKILGSYIQKLGYEDEKRDDVLYGYPNEIISYPVFPGVAIPMWLAEGTAQHMYDEIFFDYWDSIRDMILRDRILNKNMLTFNQMNSFGKCGMGNELVYNFGYSLVEYISKVYGESALKEISISLSKPFNYSINKAVNKTIGITGDQLYADWKGSLEDHYSKQISNVEDLQNYIILEEGGIANINPRWSPNSKEIAYLSDKDNDYFGRTDLFVYSLEDSSHNKIKSGVKSIPAWINDSLIVYTKLSKPDNNGSKYFDLYQYNFETEEEDQLTDGLRLFSPIYDKVNDQIIAVNTYDGTSNIVVGNSDFSDYEILTNFNNGIQIYSLTIYNENYLIDALKNHERDLYLIDRTTGELSNMIVKPWDVRDPKYVNGTLLYSDDRGGIYNLYLQDDTRQGYITNLPGGAFKPDISNEGKIVFSIYQDGGYKLALIDNPVIVDEYVGTILDKGETYYSRPTSVLIDSQHNGVAKNYEEKMTGPFFFPRIMIDYDTVKPGLYFFDNEALRTLSLLGGFAYNTKKDLDFFLLFDYNKTLLTYYFNFYWMSRHTSRSHNYVRANGTQLDNIIYDVDYTYHLFSTDIGTRFIYKDHKFWLYYTYLTGRQFYDVTFSQELPQQYINDFFYGNEPTYFLFSDAYDYFRGHSITLKYEFDGRKRHYLYSMMPSKGFKVTSSISYEKNNLFEEFKVNEDHGGFSPYLADHNTFRFMFDIGKYSRIDLNKGKNFISIQNNIIYNRLSNDDADDFVYFFGGGLPGLKGYSFYEPTLQGPELFIFNSEVRMQLFSQKADRISIFSLSGASFGLIHQFGKSNNARIIGRWSYPDYLEEQLKCWLDVDNLNNIEFDALDKDDNIPDQYENVILVNVYDSNSDNNETMEELKNRYYKTKTSIGIEFRLFGFSFYSYPTALSYECHLPYKDSVNKKGRHYLKLLFDF